MRPLRYARVTDVEGAVATVAADPDSAFLAGGTTEVDLIRLGVARPSTLVDINALPLADVDDLGAGLRIGALARMSDVARDPRVVARYPAVAEALLLGASEQLRTMASIGGNLCQRTRCPYFRDDVSPCNKREPGSGCAALDGISRGHAILGTSEHCIATHPSDMCVALAALDATVHVDGTAGARTIPFGLFHRLPGDTPHLETALQPDELITSVQVPPLTAAANSMYRKIRDRSSYAFALVSVAAAVATSDGLMTDVRIALGGVAHRPWRALEAERILRGAPANDSAFQHAAEAELAAARPAKDNGFKIELARRTIVSVLRELTERGSAQ